MTTVHQSWTPYFLLSCVMPAVVSSYLVPYTLGGTTIMIDASELPAMPSPLLKHVMRGLDKRLQEPGVSSMVHTIAPASKPVKLPPPEPIDIGLNNYKFRTGLPHVIEPYENSRYEGLGVRPGLSNDFYTTDDGLVHFDIINQDMNSNAIDQEASKRLQPADDVNSYNKLNMMTSESPPDLNPLTVKPNIRENSGQDHVNREYSGVSVKHLVEKHLNQGQKDGLSGMHVNPEPVYEKQTVKKDTDLAQQNLPKDSDAPKIFKHKTRESGGQITALPEESGQDNALHSLTFSFPGSEQLLYEKETSAPDSIQKRFAGQPPENDFEDEFLSSDDNEYSIPADSSEHVFLDKSAANLQLTLPPAIVEKINKHGSSKHEKINSAEEEKSIPGLKFDVESFSGENTDVFQEEKLEATSSENPDQTVAVNKLSKDSLQHSKIGADSLEASHNDHSANELKSEDTQEVSLHTKDSIRSNNVPEHSERMSAKTDIGNAEKLSKNARRSESQHHKMAVEALEQMRLKNNVQMIVNSLRDDPEMVPAEQMSEILSPGTMSYSQSTNPAEKPQISKTNAPSALTKLVNKSNFGNLSIGKPAISTTDPSATNTRLEDENINSNLVTQSSDADSKYPPMATESSRVDATDTLVETENMDSTYTEAGVISYRPVTENDVHEIPTLSVGSAAAMGSGSQVAADESVNMEQELSGDSANGGLGSAMGGEQLLVGVGGSLHSVTEDIFRKDSCHCGIRLSHKIVGGSVATITEFPWMVGLALKANNFTFCGATLITDRHVLTAAHCVFRYQQQPSALYVKTGRSDRSSSASRLNVKAIRVHPKYSDFDTAFDIAVVALTKPVQFSANLLPVCPPSHAEPADVYKNGVVVGWGKTDPQGPVSTRLRKATVNLLTPAECRRQSSYESTAIDNKIICASAPGRDSCQGDSGGPLMVSNNNIIEAIGIVSWGIGCAEEQHPGVYTKIYSYRTWIKAMTRSGTKCKAQPIVPRAEPEPVVDYRKEHNIFSGTGEDGVELYPLLRPAERFKNKFLLQFEEPESYVFRRPILDDRIDGFDYASDNSGQSGDTFSEIGMRKQTNGPVNSLGDSFSRRSDQNFGDPGRNSELIGNAGTFGLDGTKEVSPLYDINGNFHPSANTRHAAGERAVLSQPFHSTVPISYDEGEELADVFKLVNEELTSNDERLSDDEISLPIGDRIVSSHSNEEFENEAYESSMPETFSVDDEPNKFESPIEQNVSDGEVPLQTERIEELMREEFMNEKPEEESSTSPYTEDTTVVTLPTTEQPNDTPKPEDLILSQQRDSLAEEEQQTITETSVEASKNGSILPSEPCDRTKESEIVREPTVTEPAPAIKDEGTIKLLKEDEPLTDQQVETDSSADHQSNVQQAADGKPSPEISAEKQSNYTIGEKQTSDQQTDQELDLTTPAVENYSELPLKKLPSPVKLLPEVPEKETNPQTALTPTIVENGEQVNFYSKPIESLSSEPNSQYSVTHQNRKSSSNLLYQNILDRIRIATDSRTPDSLLTSGTSSALFSNVESIDNTENNPSAEQIVTQTDQPRDDKPSSTVTSLITIADVLGHNDIPISTRPPLDIEAIEDLIHNLGQNERKLDTQNFGDTLELYKRDTDRNESEKRENFRTDNNERHSEGNDRDDELETSILALQDELIHNISKTQREKGMSKNSGEETKGTNKTLVVGEHVVEITKPNFLNLSTDFETTTTVKTVGLIKEEDSVSNTRQSHVELQKQSGTGFVTDTPKIISAEAGVNDLKESEKQSESTSNGANRNETTNSIVIEAHSVEISSSNGYITLNNFTIGKPGHNFTLAFDDIDNRTASVLGQEPPKKNLANDGFIILNNFTIGSPGFNFTLDFDDINQDSTVSKINATQSEISNDENIESPSEIQENNAKNTPSAQTEMVSIGQTDAQIMEKEELDDGGNGHMRYKGDKVAATNTTHAVENNGSDLLVEYVIKNSKINTKSPTIDTESSVLRTSETENLKSNVEESSRTRNETQNSELNNGVRTQTNSTQANEMDSVTESPLIEGNKNKDPVPTHGNSSVGSDIKNPEINTADARPTEITEEATDISATEPPTASTTRKTLEERDRLRVIQSRIAKIQDEAKPEEDVSFLGMIQRHIFPATTSRRRINDKVRAYRKPEDDLNEALRKIFSHYEYYDEPDTRWA